MSEKAICILCEQEKQGKHLHKIELICENCGEVCSIDDIKIDNGGKCPKCSNTKFRMIVRSI